VGVVLTHMHRCPPDHEDIILYGRASELFNILVNPVRSEFALCWHRDDVKGSAGEDEEREALAVRHYGVRGRSLFICCSSTKRIENR